MATTWYFRDTNSAVGPTAFVVPGITDWDTEPLDKNTPKDMSATPGNGQKSCFGTWKQTTWKYVFARIFIGPALAAQTLTGNQAGFNVGVAFKESSSQMNVCIGSYVYLWRSGVGKVDYISSSLGDNFVTDSIEHGTGETECLKTFTGNYTNVSILDGDRIVVEMLWWGTNSKDTDYTATLYYDGTDTTMVDGTATSDAGSYFYCPQTLNLYVPPSTSIKTINGLLYANVKTVNGLVIASMKTWNGLAFWIVSAIGCFREFIKFIANN